MPFTSSMAHHLMSVSNALFTKSVSVFQYEKGKENKRSALLHSSMDTFANQDDSESNHNLRRFPQTGFVVILISFAWISSLVSETSSGACKIEEYNF